MTPQNWDKLTDELAQTKKHAKGLAMDVQRLARERNEALNLLVTLDETRAKLAVARATLTDLRVKLAEAQKKYNDLVRQVAA